VQHVLHVPALWPPKPGAPRQELDAASPRPGLDAATAIPAPDHEARIASLEATVTRLEAAVTRLEAAIAALLARVRRLEGAWVEPFEDIA
jgi:hypothetical protein